MARTMPPVSAFQESVITILEETRSVHDTARHLKIPVQEVQKVALMAFGLGRLEVQLKDY